MSEVTVVATIKAKSGKEAALKDVLVGLLEPSRNDPGHIQYDLHQSIEEPGVFVFYEIWESKELLEAHLKTPHLSDLLSRSEELIEDMDVQLLEKIEN